MNKLWFVLLALATIGTARAQVKIAVINTQKALIDTDELKKDQLEMQTKFKPRQEEMAKLQQELQDIQTQLNSGKLNELGTQQMQDEGQRKQRDLQRMQQDMQEDVDSARNSILQKAGAKMQAIVKAIAAEKGIDIVVDSANTVFYKPALDITADCTAAYNKAYPVK